MDTGQRGQYDYKTSMPSGRRLSLNALISIYIEPFSPLDQDFSFPTSPADGQHFTVPEILSDPLYQSPDKENHHLASSPPDYPPSVQQIQSSLTDGLPQREDLQLSCSGLPHHLSSGRHDDSLSKFYLQSGDQLPLEGNSLIAPGSLEFCDRATEAYSHDAGCLSESNGNSLTWSQDPIDGPFLHLVASGCLNVKT
ncbi:uncharacterized protein LOC135199005 [Macrobrachium nipponense]|uniref:uncharacterized protein LOC135199005 n=1 Tax=Macrobrachium nipponense TaxID=159736 RepID=UPI0030C7C5B7